MKQDTKQNEDSADDTVCCSISKRGRDVSNWESFIRPDPAFSSKVTSVIQDLYKFVNKSGRNAKILRSGTDELYVEGFSDDQIWQQIDVTNRACVSALRRTVNNVTQRHKHVGRCLESHLNPNDVGCDDDVEDDDDDNGSTAFTPSDSDSEDISDQPSTDVLQSKYKSIVDDKFFNLSEMEQFLDREDAREVGERINDDEDIDMFYDLPSNDDDGEFEGVKASELRAKDFLRLPTDSTADDISQEDTHAKSVRFNLETSEDDNSDKVEKKDLSEEKSPWDKRQEKMKLQISKLEEELVSEKPWQLMGEVTGYKRPENSLLEEHVEFDRATRLAPVITEETTFKLEDLIKQRIKDECWDDVEKKVKPTEQPFEFKKRLMLDQEKSKKSLHELYEEEYFKHKKGSGDDGTKDLEDENPAHAEIRQMMESLFYKLNALSNYHYTPKLPRPDVKIINNMPSISMEEVAPVHVSDAATLAPEEIKEKTSGNIKGDLEKTRTDKLKSRRKKKRVQKLKRLHKEKKEKVANQLNPGLGNKYSKKKLMEQLSAKKLGKNVSVQEDDKMSRKSNKAFKSSKTFFDELQSEVLTHMAEKKSVDKKKKKKLHGNAEKYKL